MGLRDNFKKGTVELMILSLLSKGDKYGYELSQSIAELSGQVINVPEGSLYPTLYRLVDNGFVTDKKVLVGRRMTRVYYHLEEIGHARLKEMLTEYRLFSEGLDRILSAPNAQSQEETP